MTKRITLDLDEDVVRRAEQLAATLAPKVPFGGRLTRARLLVACLERGLALLEST
jgi:hypothetical protein